MRPVLEPGEAEKGDRNRRTRPHSITRQPAAAIADGAVTPCVPARGAAPTNGCAARRRPYGTACAARLRPACSAQAAGACPAGPARCGPACSRNRCAGLRARGSGLGAMSAGGWAVARQKAAGSCRADRGRARHKAADGGRQDMRASRRRRGVWGMGQSIGRGVGSRIGLGGCVMRNFGPCGGSWAGSGEVELG